MARCILCLLVAIAVCFDITTGVLCILRAGKGGGGVNNCVCVFVCSMRVVLINFKLINP